MVTRIPYVTLKFPPGAALCLVIQPCPTLCDPVDCHLSGPSVHGDSPGKNTGVGCHSVLQGIFPTQGSNPGLPHCSQILYRPSHQGSPRTLEWVAYPFSRGSSQPKNRTKASCIAGKFFTRWATREAHSPILTSKCPQGTPCQVRRRLLTAWEPCHPGLQPRHTEYPAITIQSYSGGWQNSQSFRDDFLRELRANSAWTLLP